MSTFVPIFLLFLLGLLPVNFHLYYHRRGKDDYFALELRLYKFYVWRYEIPSMTWEGTAGLNQETLTSAEGFGTKEDNAQKQQIGFSAFLSNLLLIGRTLKKYGLGGTFFYFFLPEKYRQRVTVEEKMERKGRFNRFVWRTVLGGVEPAALGPAVGLFWSAKGVIVGFLANEYRFKEPPQIMVVPNFREKNWETMLDCIFEIKLGHIIVAGIKEYLIQLGGGKKHARTPD
ncbi:MAG: DUF2953 domain-containing protein [Firmicutes bacterium]|nr:DUF2953 domain-containing protein [Bacillota bacterium]